MNDSPLVSIIVITYNSSKFVLETLESVKAQTFQNIELVVSDDSSSDETVEICKKWVNKNKERFVSTECLTSSKNTGISSNANRGIKVSKGEWIKLIAGDDTLLPTCIDDNINFVQNNKHIEVCHSKLRMYNDNFSDSNFICETNWLPEVMTSELSTAKEQFNLLIFKCNVSAPTVFIKKGLITKFGGFDESIPQCEDWPMWINFTRKGYKIYFLDKATVNYRISSNSVFNSSGVGKLFNSFFKIERIVYKKHIKPYTSFSNRFFISYSYFIKLFLELSHLNKPNFFCEKLYFNLMRPYQKYINSILHLY